MTTIDRETLLINAKAGLLKANRAFAKNPNASNWTAALAAMLVWQQTEQLTRSSGLARTAELLEVCERARDLPADMWGELIVRKMTSQSIGEVLAKH